MIKCDIKNGYLEIKGNGKTISNEIILIMKSLDKALDKEDYEYLKSIIFSKISI